MKTKNLLNKEPLKDSWKTPEYFYNILDEMFNFDFDPCPLNHNLEEWDGLKVEWGERNSINPPYSRKLKEDFVYSALYWSKQGKLCVLLLPVSTSTDLFHKLIFPYAKEIYFVDKRIKFEGINLKGELVSDKCGTFDSMVVVLKNNFNDDLPIIKTLKHKSL